MSDADPAPTLEPDALEAAPTEPASARQKPRTWIRVTALVVVLVATYIVGRVTGVMDDVDVESVRRMIDDAGALGVVLYIAIFTVGELLHVPGIVFVSAGLLAWGQALGYVFALLGSLVSVSVSFFVVRSVGGRALAAIERPFIKKILARLDAHPIQTVFVLRLILFLTPALNYALALTRVRYRDYLIGSALGLVIPLAVVTLLFDWVMATFF